MSEKGRNEVPDGRGRRWLTGEGNKEIPKGASALLRLARHKTKRFQTTARSLGADGIDQVAVERRLYELLDAGLIEIHERRDRRGDFEPYAWRLTEAARESLDEHDSRQDVERTIESFLDDPASRCDHPLVETIHRWLPKNGASLVRASRILMAVSGAISRGQWPTERGVSLEAFGNTKVVRIGSYPEAVEEVLGISPGQVVRRPGQAVYVYGPFEFSMGERRIGGQWSRPWLALTQETLDALTDLTAEADRLLTIENLTAFEEAVRAGLPPRTVALYTGGFPGAPEIRMSTMLIGAGLLTVDHWSDLDLGGLRIYRYLQKMLPAPVSPYRMEPGLLDKMPTAPLTHNDQQGLDAWLADESNPLRELAARMLEKNRKAEQEGWFLQEGVRG